MKIFRDIEEFRWIGILDNLADFWVVVFLFYQGFWYRHKFLKIGHDFRNWRKSNGNNRVRVGWGDRRSLWSGRDSRSRWSSGRWPCWRGRRPPRSDNLRLFFIKFCSRPGHQCETSIHCVAIGRHWSRCVWRSNGLLPFFCFFLADQHWKKEAV